MKKFLRIVFGLLVVTMTNQSFLFAQEEKSISKQINEIKRDGGYVYAESTAETEEDAEASAKDLLLVEVSDYLATQLILSELPVSPQMLTMPRGEKFRVFLYIKKSDLDSGKSDVEPKSKADNDIKEVVAEPKEIKDVAVEPEDNYSGSIEKITEIKQPEEKQVTSKDIVSKIVYDDPTLNDWQKRLLDKLAVSGSMVRVKIELNKFKAHNKVKRLGGPETPCNNPNLAFFVMADTTGKIISILSPETPTGDRIDYLTGNTAKVSGNLYVWFMLSK